ncbi:alpha/beta hydrolase family protein [Microtetraspora glauca]|uniref:Poly(ethylene terephthalate) hydrolase n=1 Tax=Microtetraspora glauca TaxID=1996 RepID=A0ABV3GLG2_MICGL
MNPLKLLLRMSVRLTAVLVLLVAAALTAPAASASTQILNYREEIHGDASTVWYPANPGRRLPVALIMTGGKVKRDHYERFAQTLAGYGFVVVIPDHYRLVFTSYGIYPSESVLWNIDDWAHDQLNDGSSPVRDIVDPEKMVVSGHSFGGAATLYAAANRCQIPFCFTLLFQHPRELKAVVLHGTNTTNNGAVDAVAVDGIPVMFVNGSQDGVSTPDEAHETFTKVSGTPSAAYVSLLGANHYGLADENNPNGADPDSSAPTLSQEVSAETAARWTAMWFLASLGDTAAHDYVHSTGDASDPNVTVELR